MPGDRGSEWEVLRRCIMHVARLLRGATSNAEALAIVSLGDKDAPQDILAKRWENDRARLRKLGCIIEYDRINDAYSLTSAGIFEEIINASKRTTLKLKPSTRTRGYSAETFVRVWQTSDNLEEFARRSKMTPASAATRAALYRGQGIPLKKMPKGRTVNDWDALANLARDLESNKEAE